MDLTMKTVVSIIEVLVFILVFFAGYFIRKFFSERHLRETEERAKRILEESKKEFERKSWSSSQRT